jgi:signal transduction histidine kinase
MKSKRNELSRKYQAVLRKYLKRVPRTSLRAAQALGRRAINIGLETLDMARIHEQALSGLVLPGHPASGRDPMIRRAAAFFAEAITPIEKTHRTALEANFELGQMNAVLRRHSTALTASTRQLEREIVQRKSAEDALRKSEQHYGQLLEQSQQMQEQLRHLSRQLLAAQEDERKRISRELHDVIAQTLAGINVRLASLKKEANLDREGLERNIARTQELVQRSVEIVHRFARELRPAVLDDLGLIPALHTFMKGFREETGIRVSLSVFAGVEQAGGDKRTVLYRVAQEALTNVTRHAQATEADIKIQKRNGDIWMNIRDNGKGFQSGLLSNRKKSKRLGLLGMRERLEMVGGSLNVTSTPGKGTMVQARIPFANNARGGGTASSNTKH